jgi:hypothetical protein
MKRSADFGGQALGSPQEVSQVVPLSGFQAHWPAAAPPAQ